MRASVVLALALIGVFAGSVLAYAAVGSTSGSLDIDLKDVPVKQAIDTLFEGRGLKYYIQPGVKGRIVELRLKGISLDEGLQALGDAAGFSFRVDNGAYIISPGKAAPNSAPAAVANVDSPFVDTAGSGGGPAMRQQPPPPVAPQVVINNNISSPPPVNTTDASVGFGAPFYGVGGTAFQGGWFGPTFNLGAGPYVFGQWAQPPPPSGWVTPDVERFLRFNYAVPRRPGYAAPYPYFYP